MEILELLYTTFAVIAAMQYVGSNNFWVPILPAEWGPGSISIVNINTFWIAVLLQDD